jgi:diphthamide biosynthesis protein 2
MLMPQVKIVKPGEGLLIKECIIDALAKKLAATYQHIITSDIQTEETVLNPIIKRTGGCGGGGGEDDVEKATSCGKCGDCDHQAVETESAEKRTGGRTYTLPTGITLDQCVIYFIGHEGLTLTNIMMVHHQCQVSNQGGGG